MDEQQKAQKQLKKIQEERLENEAKKSKAAGFIQKAVKFLTHDMWRLYSYDVGGIKGYLLNAAKVLYISITEFINGNVSQKASALTYTTLLSIVPFFAILLSIATGFGMRESVQEQLYYYLPGHTVELQKAFEFVQSYMDQIQGGVVIGIGVIVLLYTVLSLMATIEDTFNEVWHITNTREWSKRLLGYFAAFFILPLLMAVSAGTNVFISSLQDISFVGGFTLSPLIETLLRVIPFVAVVLIFTFMYWIMPNAKVGFVAAFIPGLIAGIAFHFFQFLYISGQIWVSKYNAIYGSFAAIPLLLLFIQLSWLICLFGAQLSYAIQNIERYAYKKECANISRRFIDFVAVVIMKKVCTNFKYQEESYTAEKLAKECNLPIIIITDTLNKLIEANLLLEHPIKGEPYSPVYLPKLEVEQITIGRVLSALDRLGAEEFGIDIWDKYADEWNTIRNNRINPLEDADRLVVDI
ncbi:YihY/virulence factor BrkB family protein [Porphyromonas sp.]|uniref:YihY/virulence factor BrkB family protein n=1 Tax=Porphyromonas sp. TaxID=1924944 RepID=UPI0026DD51E4|nr:YihY/virulence factor BrkB family protein [Porphyromonas sp.]MDO4770717.1 YihY/virulence factor BrkB family protein [Porphyromonas sp.]